MGGLRRYPSQKCNYPGVDVPLPLGPVYPSHSWSVSADLCYSSLRDLEASWFRGRRGVSLRCYGGKIVITELFNKGLICTDGFHQKIKVSRKTCFLSYLLFLPFFV